MEWGGAQWVLATLFACATVLNLAGTFASGKPITHRLGWLLQKLSARAVIIAILISGGFF